MGLHEELTDYGRQMLKERFIKKNCAHCKLYVNDTCSIGIEFNANKHVREDRAEGMVHNDQTGLDDYVTGLFHIYLCESRVKK